MVHFSDLVVGGGLAGYEAASIIVSEEFHCYYARHGAGITLNPLLFSVKEETVRK